MLTENKERQEGCYSVIKVLKIGKRDVLVLCKNRQEGCSSVILALRIGWLDVLMFC